MAVRTILNDEIWEKFSSAMKVAGMRISASTKRIMEGVFWYLRTGSPWRDLPLEFGNWKTAYSRFNRWSKNGKLYKVFKELQDDPDFEWVSIDSTSIKVHQHASGGGEDTSSIGKSRGGRNTKSHDLSIKYVIFSKKYLFKLTVTYKVRIKCVIDQY